MMLDAGLKTYTISVLSNGVDKGKEHDKLRARVNIYKRMLLYSCKQYCITVMIIHGTTKMCNKDLTYCDGNENIIGFPP